MYFRLHQSLLHNLLFDKYKEVLHAGARNISENQEAHCLELAKKINNLGVRTSSDLRNEKISYKIRHHSMMRVPYLLVIGDKEVESNQISIRTRTGEDLGVMDVDKFVKMVETLVGNKSIVLKN